MSLTYLTTDELSKAIKYDKRTIREHLKDSVLLEGIHYFRPFGGRKILYIWEHSSQMGQRDWLGQRKLWNAYDAQNQGNSDLSSYQEPEGCSVIAWAHPNRVNSAISWD